MRCHIYGILFLACSVVGCKDKDRNQDSASQAYVESREPCADQDPNRKALWGDLHVHTSFSFDAVNYGNRLTPADALAFGQGEAVLLPPLGSDGVGTRSVRLDRPLDFLAVTDHAEFLGEVGLCWTEGSPVYDSDTCTTFRSDSSNGAFDFGVLLASRDPERFEDVCGSDRLGCQDMARSRWEAMQAAAEAAYDRTSACGFTSFPAYEYTNTRDVSNLHRNVVFQNEVVPDLPVTHMDSPSPLALWEGLQSACEEAGPGCEVLVLPHNSNLSNGQLFSPEYGVTADQAEQKRIAALRAEMEPVVEIFQHKGDSECRNGFGQPEDPHCGFEKLRPADDEVCGEETGAGGMRLWGCTHRLDFVRNVLSEGLVEEQRLGVNPYALGFIGSTDTHNGTPGLVDSWDFPGQVGIVDDTDEERLAEGNITHDTAINNPGGLSGVWATENSRVAIFDAFRRKEVFATSGPRIPVRFFAGHNLDSGLCEDPDRVATAYGQGIAMGGTLEGSNAAPSFLVEATWDAGVEGKPGVPLQQIQIVKVWLDASGAHNEAIFTVAGDADNGAGVDTSTCEPTGEGATELCAVWTDPNHDPETPASYYARVLENPSCRWSTRQCNHFEDGEKPVRCTDGTIPEAVQQRAWSSPIWVNGG